MILHGRFNTNIKSKKSGRVTQISSQVISRIARMAGAPFDKAAGVYLYKKIGDRVIKGEILFTIYAQSDYKLKYSLRIANTSESYKLV